MPAEPFHKLMLRYKQKDLNLFPAIQIRFRLTSPVQVTGAMYLLVQNLKFVTAW